MASCSAGHIHASRAVFLSQLNAQPQQAQQHETGSRAQQGRSKNAEFATERQTAQQQQQRRQSNRKTPLVCSGAPAATPSSWPLSLPRSDPHCVLFSSLTTATSPFLFRSMFWAFRWSDPRGVLFSTATQLRCPFCNSVYFLVSRLCSDLVHHCMIFCVFTAVPERNCLDIILIQT